MAPVGGPTPLGSGRGSDPPTSRRTVLGSPPENPGADLRTLPSLRCCDVFPATCGDRQCRRGKKNRHHHHRQHHHDTETSAHPRKGTDLRLAGGENSTALEIDIFVYSTGTTCMGSFICSTMAPCAQRTGSLAISGRCVQGNDDGRLPTQGDGRHRRGHGAGSSLQGRNSARSGEHQEFKCVLQMNKASAPFHDMEWTRKSKCCKGVTEEATTGALRLKERAAQFLQF